MISEILVTCLKPEKDPEVKLKMFIILSTNVVNSDWLLNAATDSGPFLIKLVKGTRSCLNTFLSFAPNISVHWAFGRSQVLILAWRPVLLTEVFVLFLELFRQILG
jgi:hypothetical protein